RHLQAEHAARLVRRREMDLVLLHARYAEFRDAQGFTELPADVPGDLPRERRLPCTLSEVGSGCRGAWHVEANAVAGAVVRLRAAVEQSNVRERPLRAQAARSRNR